MLNKLVLSVNLQNLQCHLDSLETGLALCGIEFIARLSIDIRFTA